MQPRQRPFDHPPVDTQAAAVGLPPPCQQRTDAPLSQGAPMRLRIIGPVALHLIGATTRSADSTGHRRNPIHQRQKLGHIMPMRPRHAGGQRDPLRIGDYMMLAARFAPIGRIGTGVRPPPTARTEALSTTARDQSIRSAARSWFNRIWWTRFQTPACCQARSRRQQVIPEPHPSSCGKYSQGMPVLSTKIRPVSTLRLSSGGRPPWGLATSGGKTGSMSSHNASSSKGLAMNKPPYQGSSINTEQMNIDQPKRHKKVLLETLNSYKAYFPTRFL